MAEKCSYKLLIVAYNVGLLHILTITKYLKKENPSADIHLLTNRKLDSVTSQIKQFVSKIIHIRACNGRFHKTRLVRLINKICFRVPFFLLSFRKYDIVNIHFASPALLRIMPWLAKATRNIVISPWGSDVLRLNDEKAIHRMQIIYSYASYVTCRPNSQLGMTAIDKFKFDPKKMCSVRFGLDYVDFIEETAPDKTVNDSKARFCLTGKYVITCGYSTSPSHRHDAIIDAIYSIREELPSNLVLLFPFTYGWANQQYVQSIKDRCRSLALDAVFVEEYLNMEDLYTLRMATDIFVHVQTSDAGSSCVMQYILSRKKIVHGSWMKYDELEQYQPLFYFPVNRMEDLGSVILKAYRSDGIEIPEEVIAAIMNRSWNKEIKKWNNLFCSMVD